MNKSKSSLFLMELIIVILFFSIAASVCVQLFFKAHYIDLETTMESEATLLIQNLSECYYGFDGDFERIADTFYGAVYSDDFVYVPYDADWNITALSSEDIHYLVTISDCNPDGDLSGQFHSAVITVYDLSDSNPANIDLNNLDYTVIRSQNINDYIQMRKGDL